MKVRAFFLTAVLVAAGLWISLMVCAATDNYSLGNGEIVSLLTEPQRHYLSLPSTERARYFADKDSEKPMAYGKYGTLPAPVVLTWTADVLDADIRRFRDIMLEDGCL